MNDIEKKTKIQKRQEKLKPWKPEVGEKYFVAVEDGADVVQYCEDSIDEFNIRFGNCFRTKERAEQVARKIRLLLRLEQLHDMLCPDYEPDWNNTSKQKICLGRDHADDCWFVDIFDITEYPTAYFDTEENAQKAAEILNKEMKKIRLREMKGSSQDVQRKRTDRSSLSLLCG
ncbi:MAG: hypothetical protein U0J29_05065 [Ruminococcus sp.]|nr:hypothetical protein [Ruminococcus sp.]